MCPESCLPNEGDGAFIQTGDIAIRRMRDDAQDYALMSRWLTDERVLEYYEGRNNPYDLERVIKKFGPRAQGEDRVVPCILVYQGRPIGYTQYYHLVDDEGLARHLETAEGVYGVDLFIGEPELWGKGIGTRAVQAIVDYLFGALGARWVIIDPQTSNHRAIRCYEKCGFKKVKLLPRHELHEGEHRDCWLMAIDR